MDLSKQQKEKLEKAFKQALESSSDDSDDNKEPQLEFNQGIEAILPQLYDAAFIEMNPDYVGTAFNQYKIMAEIGSGGMGNVYKAHRDDGEYDKTVAIKVLTKGFNNQSIKDRFLREKQILAQLRHQNIVPLLDAGTTNDGIPWFVLEFIDGENIYDFCKKHDLTTEAIVNLLINICDAIHFAHSQGIIHRDIKPANILIENIDGKHNPIILDFGIAHSNDEQDLTSQGYIIGTPGYMSPEQVINSEKIDRRSDIFSIGVVMYQLFSGLKPFKATSALESNQKIINNNPEKLSKLIPSFPKDLQIIVETCLNKKPTDRYQSVLYLKEDLINWINGYPIVAKKESLWVTILKAMKRNKAITILAFAIFFLTIGSVIKYTYDINQQRQIALQANAESDDLFHFLLEDLHSELTDIGRVDLLQSVAEKNLQHLNKYSFKSSNKDKLKYVSSYRNIGSVLEIQQDTTPSIEAYKKALDILLELDNNNADLSSKTTLLALTYSDLAQLHAKLGKLDIANIEHQHAQTYAQKLIDSKAPNANETLWDVLHSLSWNLMEESKYEQAIINLKHILKLSNQALENNTKNAKWLTKKFKSLIALGWYYIDQRENNTSISYYLKAMTIAEKLLQKHPNSVPYIHNLQKTNNQMAYAYLLIKDFDNAIKRAEKAIDYGTDLYNRAPENHLYYRALSYSYSMLGNANNLTKKIDLSIENFQKSLDITKEIALSSPDVASLQNDLAIDSMNFANMLLQKGEKDKALQYYMEAKQVIEKIASADDASIYYVNTYVYILLKVDEVQLAMPYLNRMKNTEGWPNASFLALVKEYNIDMSSFEKEVKEIENQ